MKTVKKNPIMGERTEVKTKVTFVEWSRKKGFKLPLYRYDPNTIDLSDHSELE